MRYLVYKDHNKQVVGRYDTYLEAEARKYQFDCIVIIYDTHWECEV